MMHLPPQAYTKETLIQAYNWLRSQPPHVQELAKSPDVLVALYSKAQMHGENYLSRTNLQGFKTELKNLAHMMGEFEESSEAGAPKGTVGKSTGVVNPNPPANNTIQVANSMAMPSVGAGIPPMPTMSNGAMLNPALSNFPSVPVEPGLPLFNALTSLPSVTGQDLRSVLDSRSWTMIQEVKNHFNLSTETEAVRLLIAMGYQKMRSQF